MLICLQFSQPSVLTKYEQERIAQTQENDSVSRSLGVPSLVSSMKEAATRNRKEKGKDINGYDEYICNDAGEDVTDDSSDSEV